MDAKEFGNETRFIGHSCEPNAEVKNIAGDYSLIYYNKICVFAKKRIQAGEEITFDYHWDEMPLGNIEEDVPCFCGAWSCRGLLLRKSNLVELESSQE